MGLIHAEYAWVEFKGNGLVSNLVLVTDWAMSPPRRLDSVDMKGLVPYRMLWGLDFLLCGWVYFQLFVKQEEGESGRK